MKQVILITGASSGMGKEFAKTLLAEGHVVYGAARRIDQMTDLEELGGHALKMDITNEQDIIDCVTKIISEQGKIDVLINNAGYAAYGAVEDTSMEDVRRQFEVNLFGLTRITQEALPYMRKAQRGRIINISSMGGKIYTPLGAFYHATKHALEGFSDCLRLELRDKGIDVVIIEPGIIKTEFGEVMMEPLLERSKEGPYEQLAKSVAASTAEMYKKDRSASSPAVIAKLVSKAVNTTKPRTRYVGGYLAKPMILLRRLLGDKLYDKLIMSQAK